MKAFKLHNNTGSDLEMFYNKLPFYFYIKELDLLSVGIYLKIVQCNGKVCLEDLVAWNPIHILEVLEALGKLEAEGMIKKDEEGFYFVSNYYKTFEKQKYY